MHLTPTQQSYRARLTAESDQQQPAPAFEPVHAGPLKGGEQKVYRFPNGYGASVVRHAFSYGGETGHWELAVIRFKGESNDNFTLVYNTPITDDVIGYLSDKHVAETLVLIAELPAPEAA